MQIRVENLRSNLALLHHVVPKKPTLKILSHVRVHNGVLEAEDLGTWVEISMPESQGSDFLIPYNTVMDLLKFVPGDEIITIDPNKRGTLKLSWSSGSAAYANGDERDYPVLDKKAGRAEGVLDGDILIKALISALPYCAGDESRPVLHGVALHLGDVVQVAAADGFRTSFQSLKLSYPIKESIILTQETVKLLDFLWGKRPGQPPFGNSLIEQLTATRPLKLSLWGDYLSIQFGGITLTSRPISGNHPDVLALMSGFKEDIKVKVMAPDLLAAIRRVEAVARSGTGIVKMQWADNQMTVSANNAEVGDISATVAIDPGSSPGRIAINIKYLLEYLAGKDGLITMGMTTSSCPAVFHYGERPLIAIMPMFVKWEDDNPPAEQQASEETKSEVSETNSPPNDTEPQEDETEEESAEEAETPEEGAESPEPEQNQEETVSQVLDEADKIVQEAEKKEDLVLSSPGTETPKKRGRPSKKQ